MFSKMCKVRQHAFGLIGGLRPNLSQSEVRPVLKKKGLGKVGKVCNCSTGHRNAKSVSST